MRKLLLLTFVSIVFTNSAAQAQAYDPYAQPVNYRSVSNPYYWKNRPPYSGYWQQDVGYRIDANLDEQTGIISGTETLTYWNNSPDTLAFVYFHLYQQAFIKGGHIENLNRANNVKQTFGKYESPGHGEVIESLKSDGIELKREQDFSVVKVFLQHPLLPNDSTSFSISFKTYYDNGSQRRRMKKFNVHGFTHYDGAHWYPRICVYDRRFGWDTDQHLGKEFYGDFGSFDVSLTLADNYMVGATGTLLNEDEVLPDSLRKKIDIKNFVKKPWESAPSVITRYDSTKRKTWHFFAENVHDFAWTADPTYRIGEVHLQLYDPVQNISRDVVCQALAQEAHAAGWQDAANFTAAAITTYSHDIGTYSWNKIIVADAQDGMEYPMLTLDGGFTPTYYDLIAHEVGHMWFFGQVGNNETYRAALDEGFTQFIESWAMKKIIGDTLPESPLRSGFLKKFRRSQLVTDARVYTPYMNSAVQGTDESINQHSDAFNGALGHGGGYNMVYFKTATMLWNLQYVLGDTLFQNAMKHYFSQWKMCHPYFEDFRNSVTAFTHVDLNWFFDEWMETTKTIDYGIKNCKRENGDTFKIELIRKGRSQMPVDLEVAARDGRKYEYYIPNTWFQRQTDATVLPKWYGWDNLHATYSCKVAVPSGIQQITIDPSNRLADVYMPDNRWRHQTKWYFDSQVYNTPDWKNYQVNWRPDVWYNAIDGIKIGFHLDGGYFNLKNKFSLTTWLNTALLQNGIFDYAVEHPKYTLISPISFNLSYSTVTDRFIKKSSADVSLKYLDGLWGGTASFTIQADRKNSFTLGVKSMYRADAFDLDYLLYPELWNSGLWNNTTSLSFRHTYQYFTGNGDIKASITSSSLFSDFNYANLTVTAINRNHIGKLDLTMRLFGRIGSGSPAPESALYLASASPEELMDNKYLRSKGFVPAKWVRYGEDINHFQQGGGLNLRGFAGYVSPEKNEEDNNYYFIFSGNSGAAINAELDFDNLLKLRPKFLRSWLHIDSYLFADAGTIGYKNSHNNFFLSSIRADAGAGLAFTVKDWGPLEKVKPLTIRTDFPVLVNKLSGTGEHYASLRWVIGIGRSF